jgi:hypothetical protein
MEDMIILKITKSLLFEILERINMGSWRDLVKVIGFHVPQANCSPIETNSVSQDATSTT